jgi:hypothetical protein
MGVCLLRSAAAVAGFWDILPRLSRPAAGAPAWAARLRPGPVGIDVANVAKTLHPNIDVTKAPVRSAVFRSSFHNEWRQPVAGGAS